jgi:hypothetical protein
MVAYFFIKILTPFFWAGFGENLQNYFALCTKKYGKRVVFAIL